jgi:citrate lyase subunit beta / citryl-CoA lyase
MNRRTIIISSCRAGPEATRLKFLFTIRDHGKRTLKAVLMLVHLLVPASTAPENLWSCDAEALWLQGDPARVADFLLQARTLAEAPKLYAWVNPAGDLDAELDALLPAAPDGLVLPAESGADVQHLGIKLAVREAKLGFADGATWLIARAGATPGALFHLGSFAGASRRLAALAFDGEALAASLRRSEDAPDAPLAVARSLTLFAAKAAGVPALLVENHATDFAALRAAATQAGFDGIVAPNAICPAR